MEKDTELEEHEDSNPEEERLDLPNNVIREEIVISVTDIVDIPYPTYCIYQLYTKQLKQETAKKKRNF